MRNYYSAAIFYFNSQPHEEADAKRYGSYSGTSKFQLTASRRGWLAGSLESEINRKISTHSLTKRLTDDADIGNYVYGNFNSQPHEEADVLHEISDSTDTQISTHSLTKRLTLCSQSKDIPRIFQLTASRRGWRTKTFMQSHGSKDFNSQPHEEADGK